MTVDQLIRGLEMKGCQFVYALYDYAIFSRFLAFSQLAVVYLNDRDLKERNSADWAFTRRSLGLISSFHFRGRFSSAFQNVHAVSFLLF